MTLRLLLTKKDPRRTDFVLDYRTMYTSETTSRTGGGGGRATTTITRMDPSGDRFQVGVIEWPGRPRDRVQLVVGTRDVRMSKAGIYTNPERFTAADGYMYEWQIHDSRPQLVPLRTCTRESAAYVATFVQSRSGSCFLRKHTSSLFIPPEGFHILDDIVVTFIYFESKWRDKEGAKAHAGLSTPV